MSMINPSNISTNVFEGRLVDTFFVADSSLVGGDISIKSNGAFSGLFSGTISASGPGNATVTTSAGSVSFKFNASKNLGYSTPGGAGDDEQEIVILVRKPSSLATADLTGTWRISTIQIPTSLTENFCDESLNCRQADSAGVAGQGERLVDIFHTARFELQRLQVLIDDSGVLTGSISGSMSATGDTATISIDGESLTLHPNADKTFMVGANVLGDSHELILCVKTADTRATNFEEEADLQAVQTNNTLILNWNSGNNMILEESSTLSADWATVEEAEGSDSYAVGVGSEGSRFFRISEAP